jgi:hypothetical protein
MTQEMECMTESFLPLPIQLILGNKSLVVWSSFLIHSLRRLPAPDFKLHAGWRIAGPPSQPSVHQDTRIQASLISDLFTASFASNFSRLSSNKILSMSQLTRTSSPDWILVEHPRETGPWQKAEPFATSTRPTSVSSLLESNTGSSHDEDVISLSSPCTPSQTASALHNDVDYGDGEELETIAARNTSREAGPSTDWQFVTSSQPDASDESGSSVQLDLVAPRNRCNMPQAVYDFLAPPPPLCSASASQEACFLAREAHNRLERHRFFLVGAIKATDISLEEFEELVGSPAMQAVRMVAGVALRMHGMQMKERMRLLMEELESAEDALIEACTVVDEVREKARLAGVVLLAQGSGN